VPRKCTHARLNMHVIVDDTVCKAVYIALHASTASLESP